MEQLFLSPAKAPLCCPEPSQCLSGVSSELEEKLGPVQSLEAASSPSQTAEESPSSPANLPGGHCTRALSQLGAAGQEKPDGERWRGPKHPTNPQAPQTQLAAGEAQPCPPRGEPAPLL